jgi:hypothetical protein
MGCKGHSTERDFPWWPGRRAGDPMLSDAPYPVDLTNKEPPVSAPMYLGKYDLSKAQQR